MSVDASRMSGSGGSQARAAAAGGKGRDVPIQFYRAVVEEIIHDINGWDWNGPEGATEEDGNRYLDMLEHPGLRSEAPDNSLFDGLRSQPFRPFIRYVTDVKTFLLT